MKQLFVPLAIIVSLIVFFVIIDRKDFNHDNDVQTLQNDPNASARNPFVASVPEMKPATESKPPVETKTVAETKPVAEAKSVTDPKSVTETKPKTDTKPAEVKAVETKPADTKPVRAEKKADKPAETKPVAQTKPEENPAPAAVPVVTAEEAEKKNIEAIAEAKEKTIMRKIRTEPFYPLYVEEDIDGSIDKVSFEGTVRSSSLIPDPKQNDYPDCLYALLIEIDSVLSNTSNTEIAHEVIVEVPIMKENVIVESNRFLPGDKISCVCAEYDRMPQEIQRMQISDDIQSFEYEQFYALIVEKIYDFKSTGNKKFSKREISLLPIQSLPKDEQASHIRSNRIISEIKRIEEELKEHGGSFNAWKKEYEPVAEKYKKLCEDKYNAWINDSYYYACGEETQYQTEAYINGILPYKKYLEENNIDLIILRIPSKGDFAARVLASDSFQENPAWVEHYYECLKNDIEIVDPMPEMWKHRFDYPLFYFYHPETENHPFEGQAFISARVISDVLKRYPFSRASRKIELEDYSYITDREPRYFWPEGNAKFNPEENVSFKRVIQGNDSIGGLCVNSGSPFIFLSNSFFAYPRGAQGASVPGYTAFFLQHIPDWFYQDSTGSPIIRLLVNSPEALQKRRAVVMVGHPSYWNGSFPPFPKYLFDRPKSISHEKTIDFFSPDITIIDDESFLFERDENGISQISQNPKKKDSSNHFDIELSIPQCEGKDTCMLRINFGKTTVLKIRIVEKNEQLIDASTLSKQNAITPLNLSQDFFIPASSSRKIIIRFYPAAAFSIKNIELWYY